MVISIVMLVYRRYVGWWMVEVSKKKIKRPQVDAQGNTSQVSTWEHCLWLALKAADFRSPWAGSEGSVWLLTFFLGREIFVLMKFKGKQPLDCWCLTHVNRIKWVECFSSPGTKPWIILVVTSHWIKGSLQATLLPSKQQIDDSCSTCFISSRMPPVSSRQDGGFCFVSCFFSTSVAPFLGTCLAWF